MRSRRCAFFSGLEHLIILMLFATQDSVSFTNIIIHSMNPSLSYKNGSIDRKYLCFNELFTSKIPMANRQSSKFIKFAMPMISYRSAKKLFD